MTTEDDFQRQLDAAPDDHQTRLVFADWLDERNDPRAAGYRALGALRKHTRDEGSQHCWTKLGETDWCSFNGHEGLDDDWFDLITNPHQPVHAVFGSRREAEDAAALVFGQLPERRRRQILEYPQQPKRRGE